MDYNAQQTALSTCQIGIMQDNLNSCLQGRYVWKCTGCLPSQATFDVPAYTCGQLTNIWLEGRASFNVQSFTIKIEQVGGSVPFSLPYSGTWQRQPAREQLDALFSFQANKLYRVRLTTYNGCGVPAVRVKYISTTCLAESMQSSGTSTTKTSSTLSTTSHD